MEAGETAAQILLDRPDPPDRDLRRQRQQRHRRHGPAAARGLLIPDDLSIIGYNDIPVVSRLPVPLTTVRVPFGAIAVNALDLLQEALTGAAPRTIVAAPTLIPRRSTARSA